MGERRYWSIAAILYLTIPLQMGLIDGLASRSGTRAAGLVDLRSSLLMHGCGPALVAGIAAVRLRLAGESHGAFRRRFLLYAMGLYLLYLPVGFGVATLSYRLAAGVLPPDLILECVVFCMGALVAMVFVACGSVSPPAKPAGVTGMTLRIALGFVPLAALDFFHLLLRFAGLREAAIPLFLCSLAPGLLSLFMIGRRR